jgi:hypothetical protein
MGRMRRARCVAAPFDPNQGCHAPAHAIVHRNANATGTQATMIICSRSVPDLGERAGAAER